MIEYSLDSSPIFPFLPLQLTKSEDVARNCRSRCEKQNIPYYRFSPELDEIISTIETDSEKLCDIILKAKMLLEGSQAQVDTLIQHFYYTAAHENGTQWSIRHIMTCITFSS